MICEIISVLNNLMTLLYLMYCGVMHTSTTTPALLSDISRNDMKLAAYISEDDNV